MKEWIEELITEKAQMQAQVDLLLRIISYVDENHEDNTPIIMEALQEIEPPNITVDEEGVHLRYVSTI